MLGDSLEASRVLRIEIIAVTRSPRIVAFITAFGHIWLTSYLPLMHPHGSHAGEGEEIRVAS